MFTGTADLVGWERSGDRLIKYVIAFSECRVYGSVWRGSFYLRILKKFNEPPTIRLRQVVPEP